MTVTTATSLTRSGLADYLLQRVTSVIIGAYALWVGGFLVFEPVSYATWVDYHSGIVMRWFSTLTVLAIAAHAWIGMWTVGTDYVRPHYFGKRATLIRNIYHLVVIAVLFIYVAWALQIFWSL